MLVIISKGAKREAAWVEDHGSHMEKTDLVKINKARLKLSPVIKPFHLL